MMDDDKNFAEMSRGIYGWAIVAIMIWFIAFLVMISGYQPS